MAVKRKTVTAKIAVPKAPGHKVVLPAPKLPASLVKPLTQPPKPPAAPAAPAAPGLAPVPTAHDAGYLAGVGKLDFQKTQGLTQLQEQQAYDNTDYQEAVRRAAQGHTGDVQSTRETANKQGLFYSGQLDKRLYGDSGVETLYQRQVNDANRDYQRRSAARTAARTALEQGYPLDVATLAAQEAERRVAADLANPPAADVAPAAPAPPAAGAAAPSKPVAKAKDPVKIVKPIQGRKVPIKPKPLPKTVGRKLR